MKPIPFIFILLFFLNILTHLTHSADLDCQLLLTDGEHHKNIIVSNIEQWTKSINSRVDQLYLLKGKSKRLELIDGGINGQDIEFLKNMPQKVKIITASDQVFRHYSPDFAKQINQESILRAGSRPLIFPEPHLRQEYIDLTGVFITTPETDPRSLWMGFTLNTPHVDFKLPHGLKIFDFGDGTLLIPGPPSVKSWIANLYTDYKNGKVVDIGYQKLMKEIDDRGGLKNPLEVPIFIENKDFSNLIFDITKFKAEIIKGYHLPNEYAENYYQRRVEPYLAKPYFATIKDPQVLYRGLYLTLDELNTILTQGMKLSDVQWKVGGSGISFSSSIQEASHYIFQNAGTKKEGVGVIFRIRNNHLTLLDNPTFNPNLTIFQSMVDMLPSQIDEIFLWGEYGPESLSSILTYAQANKIKPHESWTSIFSR